MIINLSATAIVEAILMYGIVHGAWVVLRKVGLLAYKEARAERNKIIHNHVKTGHKDRLKLCLDEACISLRRPGPVQQDFEVQQVFRTEP